ncbi:MAG TPA: hypothetical protein VHR16_03320 [Candidatus Limnocylindrales bacterium]|nr:hypothetical protein [Candidatus Limnocylindrales bacterium]
MLAVSARPISRLEETDLPQQRASDRKLDGDRRLKELNGYVHQTPAPLVRQLD